MNLQVITAVKEPIHRISSMICVRKPNKLCICLDPKDLNKAIKRKITRFLNDIFVKLSKAKLFLVVDCKDGFWQVTVTEFNRFLTTFCTPFGIWLFRW